MGLHCGPTIVPAPRFAWPLVYRGPCVDAEHMDFPLLTHDLDGATLTHSPPYLACIVVHRERAEHLHVVFAQEPREKPNPSLAQNLCSAVLWMEEQRAENWVLDAPWRAPDSGMLPQMHWRAVDADIVDRDRRNYEIVSREDEQDLQFRAPGSDVDPHRSVRSPVL